MLVLSGFALSFSTRKFMRAIPPSTAGLAERMRQFCGRTNARQICSPPRLCWWQWRA